MPGAKSVVGVGLVSIHERVRLLGGTVTVLTEADKPRGRGSKVPIVSVAQTLRDRDFDHG